METQRAPEAQITFCRVADLDRTTRFYEGSLGIELILDQGPCRIFKVREGAYLGFCEGGEGPSPEGVIITLVTDDVDAWYERLKAAGVEFEKPPAANPRFSIYHCFLKDPDGYLIEIQRFDDPAWSG